jgi:hypothetical protein
MFDEPVAVDTVVPPLSVRFADELADRSVWFVDELAA